MTAGDSIHDRGEFGMIDRIRTMLGAGSAIVGIGDDAAVLDVGAPEYLLATVDMLVQGVHFPDVLDSDSLGKQALAISLSDIAAMGGTPSAALISLALPAETPSAFVDGLYAGLSAEATRFGVAIVGGNMSSTPGPITIDVLVLGRVPPTEVLLRSGAEPGDILAVSGTLGERAAERLMQEHNPDHPYSATPEPRVSLGRALAAGRLAHAAIDLSDGLGSDLRHLAERSQVGAVLYEKQLPISSVTRQVAAERQEEATELALYGGEDYELLLAIPPDRIVAAIDAAGSVALHAVGLVLDERDGISLERADGRRVELAARGWQHF